MGNAVAVEHRGIVVLNDGTPLSGFNITAPSVVSDEQYREDEHRRCIETHLATIRHTRHDQQILQLTEAVPHKVEHEFLQAVQLALLTDLDDLARTVKHLQHRQRQLVGATIVLGLGLVGLMASAALV